MTVLPALSSLRDSLESAVLGQSTLVERLLIALLADGHLLVEGPPGLAKTRAIKALADGLDAGYRRVQFTPDLLPSDLTGTEVYRPQDGTFAFQHGPLFNHVVLADEINRAPAKVQSALLEAMAERQVSVGHMTRALPAPFLVMATQNPLEQEGTYPLPEAQLDRFLLHVRVDYPDDEDELRILRLVREEARASVAVGGHATAAEAPMPAGLALETVMAARREVLDVYVAPSIEDYAVRLVTATRASGAGDDSNVRTARDGRVVAGDDAGIGRLVRYGASPRATLAIDAAARARAWLAGRDYVSPEDVQEIAHDALRHRLVLSFEAEADGVGADEVIDRLLETVAVP